MNLSKIFRLAMQRGCKVKMIYQKNNEVIERIVSPRAFNADLVVCYDHFRKAQRNYKLSNILAAEILDNRHDYQRD